MSGLTPAFLLAFSALFSIVNPVGSALIFSQVTADRTHEERALLARRIGFYSALIMLGALWCGAYLLSFFGVSLSALRIAGGAIVAASAWRLLFMPDYVEETKHLQASDIEGARSIAFFPLTMPFTAGPGTISVAITIGSNLPSTPTDILQYAAGASAAAIAVAVLVWISYASADRILALLGPGGARVLSRLSAFLLLCIGVQIALTGTGDFVRSVWPHTP